VAALAVGTSQSVGVAATNIVTNGGFESGTFSGWNVSGNTDFTMVTGGFFAQSGNFGVLTGPAGNMCFISQTLTTIPGNTYQLDYWLANFGSAPNEFQVTWGGAPVATSLTDASAFGYTRFTAPGLVATSTSTTLTFAVRNDPAFFTLDNVSVVSTASAGPAADIALLTATTPDSKRVNFTYSITGAITPFVVRVYRSADEHFDSATDVLVGSTTITDVAGGAGSVVGNLVIDPTRPYVLVIADPANAIQESNEANNMASFRKLVLGIITPGFQLVGNLPPVNGVPLWVGEMAEGLEQYGYNRILRFNWSTYSNTAAPGQTAAAANLLVNEIQTAIQLMNVSPTDVIDTHWIGHSRGAVVNGQALAAMAQNGTMSASMAGGWVKMTMLDPHPAKNGANGPLCSFDSQSQFGWLLYTACAAFQAVAQDPDAVFPIRVNQPEVYFQHTLYAAAPLSERFINLWGVSDILADSHDWTHDGIGHAEIPDAYRIAEIEPLSLSTISASGLAGASKSGDIALRTDETDKLFPDYVDNAGMAQSLIAKLAAAHDALNRGNLAAARGVLFAFLDEVKAQRGVHIKADAADLFIAAANSILSSL
jgi:hypothetical protein